MLTNQLKTYILSMNKQKEVVTMANITLYTAVPQYRLSFIKKYGLLQNDEIHNMIDSQIIKRQEYLAKVEWDIFMHRQL